MTSRLSLHRAWPLVVVLGVLSGGCKPWTVRPIQNGSGGDSTSTVFDSKAYVDGVWDAKVVAASDSAAEELAAAMARLTVAGASGARTSVLVKGRARVSEVDRRSRVGLAYLSLADGKDTPRVALQIGPVLRGTALRDALPFIRFSDFINQIDFAAVAGELNARVLHTVLGGTIADTVKDRTVSFTGAATVTGTGASRTVEIVPITLRIEGIHQ